MYGISEIFDDKEKYINNSCNTKTNYCKENYCTFRCVSVSCIGSVSGGALFCPTKTTKASVFSNEFSDPFLSFFPINLTNKMLTDSTHTELLSIHLQKE